jgi:hypothetical protein
LGGRIVNRDRLERLAAEKRFISGIYNYRNPHSCLTTDWILGQFHQRRGQAEERYREFVKAGKGKKGFWEKVKGGIILGEEGFIEEVIDFVKGSRDLERYLGSSDLRQGRGWMHCSDEIQGRGKGGFSEECGRRWRDTAIARERLQNILGFTIRR